MFQIEDGVHEFKITGDVGEQDLSVLKQSIFRFFESNPTFTVLDLSEACLQVSELKLQVLLSEFKSLASSKAIFLSIAQTDIEVVKAKQVVLEAALLRQVEVLKGKLELREKMRAEAEKLLGENESLKSAMNEQIERMKELNTDSSILSPLVDKLWSEKRK